MERAELRRLALSVPGAVEVGGFVFLCDPNWRAAERDQLAPFFEQARTMAVDVGWLCIATGGSSGLLKFARHDESTIGTAVSGFLTHFRTTKASSIGVLPLHHVSGFMAAARCHFSGGQHTEVAWRELAEGRWPELQGGARVFLSLVPTQLQRILGQPGGSDFLRRFSAVFVGGGPIWPQLAGAAAEAGVPVALSYGMTETAAMIASQQPENFLRGARDVGRVMPHAALELLTESGQVSTSGTGLIRVRGGSVFRGYFPQTREESSFLTEDLGLIAADGTLRVLGRRDAVINSGGKKIWPIEVEAVLRASGAFEDVAVIGVPDAEWGEIVVACHPGGLTSGGLEKARNALEHSLSKYKHPKRFLAVKPWPRNAQGKVNRATLLAAALEHRG